MNSKTAWVYPSSVVWYPSLILLWKQAVFCVCSLPITLSLVMGLSGGFSVAGVSPGLYVTVNHACKWDTQKERKCIREEKSLKLTLWNFFTAAREKHWTDSTLWLNHKQPQKLVFCNWPWQHVLITRYWKPYKWADIEKGDFYQFAPKIIEESRSQSLSQ